MAITILPPSYAPPPRSAPSDDDSLDSEGDVDMLEGMRPAKRARKHIVTPGETVTDNPEWMKCAILQILPKPTKTEANMPYSTEATAPTNPKTQRPY